jgi:hypothetical protein
MRSILLIGLIAACGGGGSDTDSTDLNDAGDYNCAADTRGETYVVGLDHQGDGKALDFKLMNADPAPPARNDNDWDVEISSMTSGVVGDGVAGGQLIVTPYMPDHAHGSPIQVTITDNGQGMYHLHRVNLWMPGLWETTIQAATSAGSDSTVFRFCISE